MEFAARKSKRLGLKWGLLSLLLLFNACAREVDPDAALKVRLAELQERTLPPGSRIANSSGLIRSQFSVAASWEFETDWDWQKYSEWLRSQLVGFEAIRSNSGEIVFSRPVGNDTESITVRALSTSQRLQVHVSFRMYSQ
jgi:hypothetical protein